MADFIQSEGGIYRPRGNGREKPARATAQGTVQISEADLANLQERIGVLELALEDLDWLRVTWESAQEFSREGLKTITQLARIFFLKNPLIRRGIEVKKFYIWGQGIKWSVNDDDIKEAIQAFMDDEKNKDELTSHQAALLKEQELTTDANLFFVFFVNQLTGRVRIRTIPFDEIVDVICNPDDRKDPWYYLRKWTTRKVNPETGESDVEERKAYYPDWRYTPIDKRATIDDIEVRWDNPVYHVKVGGFSDWKFGVSEVYSSLDWSRAYKEYLEDWIAIVRAYRRFAFQLSMKGASSARVQAAGRKFSSTYGNAEQGRETNPPPVTGSVFVSDDNTQMTPVRTAGATASLEEGRRIALMAMAGIGLPETFYGDASVGSLATAKSLDRPTELMMLSRQTLWADIYGAIFKFVLFWAVKAAGGPLSGHAEIKVEVEDGERIEKVVWNDGIDADVKVNFPPIVTDDVPQTVAAIISAATLNGQELSGLISERMVAEMLMRALGIQDIDEALQKLFGDGDELLNKKEEPQPQPGFVPGAVPGNPLGAAPVSPNGQQPPAQEEQEAFLEAMRWLTTEVHHLMEAEGVHATNGAH